MKTTATFGVIVGNRGFFAEDLAREGREEILQVLKTEGIRSIILPLKDSKTGAVETWEDAKKCARLFREAWDQIDGVLVSLPNFGEERAIADALRLSGLSVPVLIQAYPDDLSRMTMDCRRDSFCGKLSLCNNLKQYGIPFSLTRQHTVSPASAAFRQDLGWFASVCRVVRGLRSLRIGAIGARPAAFNTVRFSEKLLELQGITVETLDLSEVFGRTERMDSRSPRVLEKIRKIKRYLSTSGIPAHVFPKMAKFALVVEDWMEDKELNASAIQCWTAIEEYFGIVPCTVMSMMSEALLPSACEMDVTGAVAMAALQFASGKPSALMDWNNNYKSDPEKTVLFHCSNFPRSFIQNVRMDMQEIIAGVVGKENSYGTCTGRIVPGPFTFLRVSTDDESGEILSYFGEGEFTRNPLKTFGSYGVARIKGLQTLLHVLCSVGFEHHVAVNLSRSASVLEEALDHYLNWNAYYHRG